MILNILRTLVLFELFIFVDKLDRSSCVLIRDEVLMSVGSLHLNHCLPLGD